MCLPNGTKHAIIQLSFIQYVIGLPVGTMAQSTCQYANITESFCLPSLQWHEVAPPVTGMMTCGHSTTLKHACSLLNMHPGHTASQRLQGLWIPPRGDSRVPCCINKENACPSILTLPRYLQSTLTANAKGLKGQRECEVILC